MGSGGALPTWVSRYVGGSRIQTTVCEGATLIRALLSVVVAGANVHDKRLVAPTLDRMAIDRPAPTSRRRQRFCADKGYDYLDVHALIDKWGYTAHIKSRGQEKAERETVPGYRARRWVVERTHSWFNRFRRLLIRWEKKSANYLAFLHFARAWVTFRASAVLG